MGPRFLARSAMSGNDVLLLASQTNAQWNIDADDGMLGDDEHGPVYRLDRTIGEFALVEDAVWETGGQPVSDCLFSFGTDSPFTISAFQLVYEERVVSVAGGSAVTLRVAPKRSVINVLSADGVRPVPFLGVRSFDGQHYHELFSELNGSRVGSAVKIGVGAVRDSPVDICWTRDEQYVIYFDLAAVDTLDVFNVCVVPVGDTLRDAGVTAEP